MLVKKNTFKKSEVKLLLATFLEKRDQIIIPLFGQCQISQKQKLALSINFSQKMAMHIDFSADMCNHLGLGAILLKKYKTSHEHNFEI